MSIEHPVEQPIEAIRLPDEGGGECWYKVGTPAGVTRIEATTKSGMYADIAYIRVWMGETAVAEFPQHNLLGVYFAPADDAPVYAEDRRALEPVVEEDPPVRAPINIEIVDSPRPDESADVEVPKKPCRACGAPNLPLTNGLCPQCTMYGAEGE